MRNFVTDFTPEEHMLVISYADRPGLIGKIGTILGEEGINIGNMNLGRQAKAGEAMVVLSTDSPVEQKVIDRLTAVVDPLFIKAVHLSH
jgi:D-3-phosphoglycerate dehydrogenase